MSIDQDTLNQLRIDRTGSSPKNPWPVLGAIVVIGIGAVLFYAWKGFKRAVPVDTAAATEVTRATPQVALNASGYVTARREATVSSKVTGQILDVLFEEGQKVEVGQPLAHVDPDNLQTSLDLSKAQYEDARAALGETQAQLAQAESEFGRVSALASNRIASGSDLDKARADAESLRAHLARQRVEITVAEKQVAAWQQQVDDTTIRAPFSGVIVTKDAQPGEIISPMSAGGSFTRTGIGTVVDMASLEIEVDVNENYINRVVPGQQVDAVLDAYSDWHIPCKVIAIIPTADRQKGTVKVRIGFDRLDPRICRTWE
jgi:RND family efflux transporter MFP subunit